VSAFYTLARFGAGLAQYAGAGAWEGSGRWGAEARRSRFADYGETHPHPTLPLKGRAFEGGALPTNPPLQGEGMGGDGFAPARAASNASASDNATNDATPAFPTDAPLHAQ